MDLDLKLPLMCVNERHTRKRTIDDTGEDFSVSQGSSAAENKVKNKQQRRNGCCHPKDLQEIFEETSSGLLSDMVLFSTVRHPLER